MPQGPVSLLVIGLCAAAAAGCAGSEGSRVTATHTDRSAIGRYVGQVELIRLVVNKLLSRADPILRTVRRRHMAPAEAARRMAALERRFAAYTVDIAAVQPPTPQLRALHNPYTRTYVVEDAYLSALVSGLAQGNMTELPNTQSAQRAAIIRWRTDLTVLATRPGRSSPPTCGRPAVARSLRRPAAVERRRRGVRAPRGPVPWAIGASTSG